MSELLMSHSNVEYLCHFYYTINILIYQDIIKILKVGVYMSVFTALRIARIALAVLALFLRFVK